MHLALAARGGGRDALARHLRPRRRVGHAGVDRSRERRRLCPDGATLEFPEQRRQRRPPPFPAGGRKRTREIVRFKGYNSNSILLLKASRAVEPHNATGRSDFVLENLPFNVNAIDKER